ncbi:translation initiation factor IF-2 [Candidatus Roizmanbacteria bacterium RIFCSPLOWO2_12_FULL_40_12]|uniref:Translation initiation factor IF-2 n=1 Tax=Candidatus Roizmanbacteria bacterium RIFCSPLOWO2_01_FULL_40_42 TaxID=1802066 RepID=A0A1F7J503_9BACT|nr:MAG: translation initiation factor IF-2 [Candidatus Roizmanbacteria bacterium RIFCSPHIGHO2_01_FULL_40_98]OGK29046.1 MAG: translation initiation factor IF-2 [Candidatus Roizmanbacteria bacterium RIFCSPHIGHO2_02_FULL_40_53]OGK29968.1 MAG: translation initiation factor IF-2 [Candidatus Roizmanbacteria bacterium RIFCSPHIGHO2_12_41_18]OGK36301.1 MAG: translation initiation factor IF-2 [Candidatus Roizmanbacteria bacterium RIFCSPHIGHO2_12_FULL_40_130]OGK50673.1 MAG: translation initiation factor I
MSRVSRPPVVAILGHVDHGKTTLLDYIRKTQLTEKEYGGITQRIGAYEVTTGIKDYHTDKLTFIDTPGHEAFTKLRLRGAEVADIALLIIDAKDSVKPQTAESILHIKAANIPFIVVFNKTDLPEANVEKVKIDLMKQEVIVEDKGGKVPSVLISAKTGKGVDSLLESILLLTSELNLTYDPRGELQAHIVETKKDRRGVVASAIIKDGTLSVGDTIYIDSQKTKVRSMVNDRGVQIKEAVPSTPFELLGFNEIPEVGSVIRSTETKKIQEAAVAKPDVPFDLKAFLKPETEEKKLTLIVKADSKGSLEAILHTLGQKANIEVLFEGVGDIHKSDIFLAKTSKAIVIGFNTKPSNEVKDIALQEKVVIKTYNIIYELIDELSEVSELLKEKEEREKNLKGEAKILATFIVHDEKIFGVKITKGKANIGDPAEIYRDKTLVGRAKLVSLKSRAKSVEEVKKDQEAGMVFNPQLDIRIGDMVKFIL